MVHTLGFSVCLRMVSGGEGKVVSKDSSEFLCEGRGELRSAARYNLFIETEACVNFVEEKSGYPLGGGGFLSQAENYPLHKPVVDHDQQEIEALGRGKVGDQITGDLLERAGARGRDGNKGGGSGMGIGFRLLARTAALDIFAHKLH